MTPSSIFRAAYTLVVIFIAILQILAPLSAAREDALGINITNATNMTDVTYTLDANSTAEHKKKPKGDQDQDNDSNNNSCFNCTVVNGGVATAAMTSPTLVAVSSLGFLAFLVAGFV